MSNENYGSYRPSMYPLDYTLAVIGGKWKLPILWYLNIHSHMRYGELKRELYKVTDKMLSQQLQELINDGIIERKQYNEVPLRVEYSLTDVGKTLKGIIWDLESWGYKRLYELEKQIKPLGGEDPSDIEIDEDPSDEIK